MKQSKFKETEIGEIPEDWDVKEIGDVCHLVRDSFSPSKEDSRAYIGLEHIEQDTLRLISIGSSKDINSNKLVFRKGQILFGKLRPYFRKVYRPNFEGVCSTDIFVIDANKKFDNWFLFYFFADRRMIEEATLSSEGTRMPRASWKYLEKLQRGFPDLSEQKAIAKILSDLDSKIELNNEMNKTLEFIGQALFKHWFVDFEFPDREGKPYKSSGGEMVESELGEIPKGWEVREIKECGKVVCGKTPSTRHKENYGDDIAFITIPDMRDQVFSVTTERKLSHIGAESQRKKELPPLSVCVSCIATSGLVSLTYERSHTNPTNKQHCLQ